MIELSIAQLPNDFGNFTETTIWSGVITSVHKKLKRINVLILRVSIRFSKNDLIRSSDKFRMAKFSLALIKVGQSSTIIQTDSDNYKITMYKNKS